MDTVLSYVPSFTLVNLAIFAFVVAFSAFIGRIAIHVHRFVAQIGDYKHLPRHPTMMAVLDLYDTSGKYEGRYMQGYKKPDGTIYPVMNLGPWGDGNTYVAVSDADANRTILNDLVAFPKLPKSYAWFGYLVGSGLLTATGEKWKLQRKNITPLFHLNVLRRSVSVMVDITKELLQELHTKKNQLFPAKSLMALHAMRVISNLAFGGDFDPQWMLNAWEKVEHAFTDWTFGWCVFGDIWKYFPLPAANGFFKSREELRQSIAETIERRRSRMEIEDVDEEDRNDLLYYLIDAVDPNGEPLSTEYIINECITFLFAGHDTSSAALAWCMYFMANHPEYFARLREEADRVLGDRDPTHEDLNELQFTKNFMKEAMRIRTVIPQLDRLVANDSEIAGYKLKAGTYISVHIWNVCHDPKNFKNPDEFNPDRWNEPLIDPYAYTPFSAGPRNCIGSKFSQQEILIALAMIAREFDVSYDRTQNVCAIFEGVVYPKNLNLKFSPRIRV